MNLTQKLQQQIKSSGPMPFEAFMQAALYDSEGGYYTSGLEKLGPKGDFTTAPTLSPLFGETLANAIAPLIEDSILEFGAGTGALCVAVLKRLEALNRLPNRYIIVEVSGDLQARQRQLIATQLPHLQDRVEWATRLPHCKHLVILANEVLDAMPVCRFRVTEEGLLESFITLTESDELIETFLPTQNEALKTHVEANLLPLPSPYTSEANLWLRGFIKSLADCMDEGVALLIDYGFPRKEYYHPDRHMGTIMCHSQHHSHPNPLIHVGLQDITAHVDFTHVAECAIDAGLHVAGFCSQGSFLLTHGLLSLLDNIDCPREKLNALRAVKIMTQPQEMGELFKVIALTKNTDLPDTFFLLQDRRASL